MQLFLLLIHHQVAHSTDSPRSHRGNHRSIIGGRSYCSFIWLNSTSTWLVSYSFYFLFNPSFLVITHLVLFLVYSLMNPYPYFKFLTNHTPMRHCSFLFCIPDLCDLSLCFLSTITSFSHCIVSSVVWRNVYKDTVHPLVKKRKIHIHPSSDQFSSVKSSSVSVVQANMVLPIH